MSISTLTSCRGSWSIPTTRIASNSAKSFSQVPVLKDQDELPHRRDERKLRHFLCKSTLDDELSIEPHLRTLLLARLGGEASDNRDPALRQADAEEVRLRLLSRILLKVKASGDRSERAHFALTFLLLRVHRIHLGPRSVPAVLRHHTQSMHECGGGNQAIVRSPVCPLAGQEMGEAAWERPKQPLLALCYLYRLA
jgi:hypothetical protein